MKYDELHRVHSLPLFELLKKSREVHEANWPQNEVQLCTLLSIKTGGCSEDCSYCSQSARHSTGLEIERLMEKDAVMERARAARASGSTRFCMGAAWKGVRAGTKRFEQVKDIIESVSELGMEVCVTLGELGAEEAVELKDAGVTAYNHNVDTSREHYPNIVTTHTYDDRLNTIRHAQNAGMSICCGGILGLGETSEDRLKMIETISEFNPQPESVPINSLMPMPGTPLGDSDPVDIFDVVRMIAVARIACPKAKVRLSAGRTQMSEEGQAMCFFAGANSIFYGDKLLTAENPAIKKDLALIEKLDLKAQAPNPSMAAPCKEEDRPASPAPCESNSPCCG
ncbi:biotin synthase BioB [Verrucomicrobiaceae bacterium R5-34]|uniref:Biotin synthase n=1 Tax=Oceaniferula flava TaxID=2800421 RepID=A0AAE2V7P5_9BACT|nr:biotin synthase BioB [Oceaniferula flavus]MBK1832071.1 biotin synthase BioB [Verrucomicrobiaceae bacterium R5-34]MBK1854157.1 biotin synthase BioB [Oceaniferula flavus]MBM1135463.1 biotin synthase BioB [Oceaniferula flavus]